MRPPEVPGGGLSFAYLKPTADCQADCSYCCFPPEELRSPRWDEGRLRRAARLLAAGWRGGEPLEAIWHGGEPMLMGADFYRLAHRVFAEEFGNAGDFRFWMQTNLLGWSGAWRDVLLGPEIFGGRVSTSWEPGGQRTVKGDPERFRRLFMRKLDASWEDGLRPPVIATLSGTAAEMRESAMSVYGLSLERFRAAGEGHRIRFNPVMPWGRARGRPLDDPAAFGEALTAVGERWEADGRPFGIEPLLSLEAGLPGGGGISPGRGQAGGVAVLPDGSVWGAAEYSWLPDAGRWVYGRIFDGPEADPLAPLRSPAARAVARRAASPGPECLRCRHLGACGGGQMVDALAAGRGERGRTAHCESWLTALDWLSRGLPA